jgi:hypothetical protein
VVDVFDHDRTLFCHHAAREAFPERDGDAALDLLLEALGRARNEVAALLVEEQDGDRVDPEGVTNSRQQLVEALLDRELGSFQPSSEWKRRAIANRLSLHLRNRRFFAVQSQGGPHSVTFKGPTIVTVELSSGG